MGWARSLNQEALRAINSLKKRWKAILGVIAMRCRVAIHRGEDKAL